jgi:peptidoglycan/xylan/chitin deacetylase (PgdA/CDA1 family)
MKRDSHDLRGIGPSLPYPLKAALTRAGSLAWLARTRGQLDVSGLRILFYHRVADDRDELAVTPRRFEAQMQLLADEGFTAVAVDEAVAALDRGESTATVVGLCFDDGFRDVAEHALPVLERLRFRASVFVASGVVEGAARFRWYGEQPPVLRWDEITALDRAGTLRFGAHTVTHPNLLAVDDEQARWEIVESKTVLESRLGRPVDEFCYPAGLFGERERRAVVEAGFRLAVSCEPGVNTVSTDRFALRRRQIDSRDALLDFRAKLGGGHDRPLPLRGVYRRVRFGEQSANAVR